jgi:hypothetical protein
MLRRDRVRLAAALAAAGVCVTGCGSGSHRASAGSQPARVDASALRLIGVRTPPLRVRHYRTRGTYPQVASPDRRLKKVNAALLEVLLNDQRQYARFARRRVRQLEHISRRNPGVLRHPGVYLTTPRTALSSASTVVVSVLVAQRSLLPAGNDGDYWLSATVPVSTGSHIKISELFAQPSDGLGALAAEARAQLRHDNRCVRHSGPYYRNAFAPSKHRYRNFALTPSGVAIGFALAEVAEPFCGRVVTTVPYDTVRPYLSALGQRLVAGVRPPRD